MDNINVKRNEINKNMKKETRFDKLIWISESQTETTYTYTR